MLHMFTCPTIFPLNNVLVSFILIFFMATMVNKQTKIWGEWQTQLPGVEVLID